MFFRFPGAHIDTHFGEDGRNGLHIQAVHLSQIHAGQPIQFAAQIKPRLPFAGPTYTPGRRQRVRREVDLGGHGLQMGFDRLIAFPNFVLIRRLSNGVEPPKTRDDCHQMTDRQKPEPCSGKGTKAPRRSRF